MADNSQSRISQEKKTKYSVLALKHVAESLRLNKKNLEIRKMWLFDRIAIDQRNKVK